MKNDLQESVNTIKDLLMESDIRLLFPLAPDLEMSFTLTKRVTKEQFKRVLEIIKLAEDSCVTKEPSSVP